MFRALIIVGLVIFLVLGASVGYFNAQPVRFNYLAGEIELPLIALVIGEFVLAVLLTLFISFGRMLSLKAQIRRLRKQINGVEAELKTLRDLSTDAIASSPLSRG
ncbi:MAG: LapA family protein [Panacagrimonas sp.]